MARIAVDATPVSSVHGKGLSRFLVSLINAFALYGAEHMYIIFVNAQTELPSLPRVGHIQYVKSSFFNSIMWDTLQFAAQLRNHDVDVVLSCADRLPLLYRGRMILYLFELPGIRHQLSWANASRYAKISMKLTDALFPHSLQRAKCIIASSHATRNALCSAFPVNRDHVDVIYPGRDESFTSGVDEKRRIAITRQLKSPDGYVLHFSSSDPRDNTEIALRAFHAAQSITPHQAKLVIAGKADPEGQGLTSVVRELELENSIIWAGFIPEDDLADVYRCADVYLDTSLYEGFGYQVLEAMSCGTPVVCSNVTSLPEIVGQAGITAHPGDIQAFARALSDVLSSRDQSQRMRIEGLKQIESFAWKETTAMILSVCELVVCE